MTQYTVYSFLSNKKIQGYVVQMADVSFIVAATLPRSHAVPSCDFSFAVWRVPLSILYIIIFIIYNIKYILIIYNFQEAVFITFEKSKWDSVAAWLRGSDRDIYL